MCFEFLNDNTVDITATKTLWVGTISSHK